MRKIAKVIQGELNENLCMDNVNLDAELSSICSQFVSELQNVLDTVTPETKVKLLKRRKTPWCDSDLKEQWKIVRNCERCLMKYGDNFHWPVYKHEGNQYNNMLTYMKKKIMKENSGLSQRHTKFYQLMNNITGYTSTNPRQRAWMIKNW